MAKVIQTILNMRDNMSKGLIAAARNTQGVTRDMQRATREAVNFKNRAGAAIASFAKTAGTALAATGGALVGAFLAMDGATEEYRVAQGKLNTAFEAAGMSADAARTSYRNFYAILGDTDTATEASQLLSKLTKNEEDITKWTRIAAGVSGTFGDSLPIEGLIEASNETARVGQVTGVLADAINWAAKEGETFGVKLKANTKANEDWNKAVSEAKSAEDFFNLALQDCATESERVQLIMDTLSGTYDKAADSFYKANKQLVDSRRNQATLQEITAKLGDASATVKNQLWELAGAQEDGTIRAGSALDFFSDKINAFSSWISGLDLGALSAQFDQGFATAVDKASDALTWLIENKDGVINAFIGIAGAVGAVKLVNFTGNVIHSAREIKLFVQALWAISAPTRAQIKNLATSSAAWVRNTAASAANRASLVAHRAVGGVTWIARQAVTLATSTAAWARNTAAAVVNKAALLAQKAAAGGAWLASQAVALGASSAAWIKNTAAMAANKIGMAASAVATGAVTAATTAASAAQWALNAAFVATPIGWIVLGLGALVAAGVALYQNWDTVKEKASELWGKITEVFTGIRDAIVGAFEAAKDKVAGFFSWIDDKVSNIPVVGGVYNGIKGAISWVAGKLAGNALGTSYWRGGLTRVNERGGEIINLPSGTQIIPHDVSTRMVQGGGVTVNVTVMGNMIGNEQYADEMGEIIVGKILAAHGNM